MLTLDPSSPVCGDVKVEFFNGSGKDKMFNIWFNTFFIQGKKMIAHKLEIDKANKDKKHKVFPETFAVEFEFDTYLKAEVRVIEQGLPFFCVWCISISPINRGQGRVDSPTPCSIYIYADVLSVSVMLWQGSGGDGGGGAAESSVAAQEAEAARGAGYAAGSEAHGGATGGWGDDADLTTDDEDDEDDEWEGLPVSDL